jgi:hypothetical protein
VQIFHVMVSGSVVSREAVMKSIREWFEGTGSPLRSKLLLNLKPEYSMEEATCLSCAIFLGFKWADTTEKHEYWWGVYDCLRSKGE